MHRFTLFAFFVDSAQVFGSVPILITVCQSAKDLLTGYNHILAEVWVFVMAITSLQREVTWGWCHETRQKNASVKA